MPNNNTMDFKRFMSPDFQASQQPQMAWMPWDDPAQQGAELGSIFKQLRQGEDSEDPAMGKGGMMGGMEGKAAGGGKGSL